MEIFTIIRFVLIGTSFGTFSLSLIFLFFPDLYFRIEELFDLEIFPSNKLLTSLEGEINFLNDWLLKHRFIFGTLFTFLSLYNIKSLVVL